MRILLTNQVLGTRTGTELYVHDLSVALLKRGHDPVVYSPRLGALAEELRSRTVPVIADLRKLTVPPDVIHGHHGPPAVEALLRFQRVPALFVCHDRLHWTDDPPPFGRFVRLFAVDRNCRERLVAESGIAPDRVEVMLNAVDTERFGLRAPLPPTPVRALVFSNQAGHVPAIETACAERGIGVETLHQGQLRGRRPEEVLGQFDVVFAKGRCALEALAVGCAVVVCDEAGLGPMVGEANFEAVRELNCGRRLLQSEVTPDNVARELARYDPASSRAVCARLREEGSLDRLVDAWLAVYREILDEFDPREHPPERELIEAADYLRRLAPLIPEPTLRQLLGRIRRTAGSWLRSRWQRRRS